MKCKICHQESLQIFSKKVLNKYDVNYFECSNCKFIQTDEPHWLDEAYNSAINFNDIGLISRNNVYVERVTSLFRLCGFNRNKKYIDYGGGYGIFVRMMRDYGFNYYWSDEYCENLFAKKFRANDLPANEKRFEVLTAFEVFEHLADPIKEIEKMLTLSDSILFSTELTKGDVNQIQNWWYIGASHGQHIAFYNKKTLEFIAEKFSLNLYSRKSLHFLTKKKMSNFTYNFSTTYKIARIYNTLFLPKSLMKSDYELYLKEE